MKHVLQSKTSVPRVVECGGLPPLPTRIARGSKLPHSTGRTVEAQRRTAQPIRKPLYMIWTSIDGLRAFIMLAKPRKFGKSLRM